MKKILLFVLPFLVFKGFAQEIRSVKGNISTVTLYSMGALVTETGKLTLIKGTNKIAFTGISSKLDPKVLLLQLSGDAKVISLTSSPADIGEWQDKKYKQAIHSVPEYLLCVVVSGVQFSQRVVNCQ